MLREVAKNASREREKSAASLRDSPLTSRLLRFPRLSRFLPAYLNTSDLDMHLPKGVLDRRVLSSSRCLEGTHAILSETSNTTSSYFSLGSEIASFSASIFLLHTYSPTTIPS
jgi:hypothetical protein